MSRVVNKLNDRGHLKPLYTLLYTLPGDPSIYYGSEWGIEGRKEQGDPALRPRLDLDEISSRPPVPGLEEYLEQLGQIRSENPEIGLGCYRELLLTNRQYAFARILGGRAVITAVNNDPAPASMTIRLPFACAKITDLLTGASMEQENGQLAVTLEGDGSGIYLTEQG